MTFVICQMAALLFPLSVSLGAAGRVTIIQAGQLLAVAGCAPANW